MTSPSPLSSAPDFTRTDADFKTKDPQSGISVIGIGADGFDGLGDVQKQLIRSAEVIVGSWRQLNLIPDTVHVERRPWPSPLVPAIQPLFKELSTRRVVVLASGDPMFHGIGSTLARELGPENIIVYPSPSSVSLACARLGWPLHSTQVVSLVTAPIASIIPALETGEKFLILGRDENTPREISALLESLGQAACIVHVLSDLGSDDEEWITSTAVELPAPHSSLNVIAVEPIGQGNSHIPGLPDDSYDSDGQLTKQDIRALTLSALAPRRGEHLWDIGGGSGSIAIEWLRSTPHTSAVTFEQSDIRQARIAKNAEALGVPHLRIEGAAPESLQAEVHPDDGRQAQLPDAIFIGGGLTQPGVFEDAWNALKPGGRLIANAVTLESEQRLWQLRQEFGGQLRKFSISTEHTIGGFTAFKPALPVTQWRIIKPADGVTLLRPAR